MALNQMGAGFVLRAYDSATPIIRRVGGSFAWLRGQARGMAGGMNAALSSTAAGFAALHAGLGMVKFAKQAADAAATFQQQLAGVGQIARATTADMKILYDAAIEAAIKTQFSPDQAVEGLQVLAAQGLRATEAVQVLIPALDLAAGSLGQMGIAGAADAVVGSIKAMGFEMSEATRVTDQLLKITQMTNFQTRDFEESMGRTASTAKLYGQTFEDSLITMGLIRNMNIEASVASTSLREAWRRLASDHQAQEEVARHGVDIFDKETGKIRDLLSVTFDLVEKTKDLTDKEKMRMVTIVTGVRGMASYNAVANATYTAMVNGTAITLRGMNAINAMRYELSWNGDALNANQEAALRAATGVEDLSKVFTTSRGTAQKFREALLDTYKGQKQLIWGTWQTLLVVFGEDFAKAMKPIVKGLNEMLIAVVYFVKALSPEAKQAIFKFVVAIGALLTLGGGMFLISGALSMLGGSVIGFVFALGKLLLIGTPILILFSGLGIGFTSLFKAMKMFGEEGMDITAIMNKVRLGAAGAMSILTGEDFSDDLKKNLEKAQNQGVVKFLSNFQLWMERLRTFWDGLKTGFQQGIAMLADSSALGRLKSKLQDIISVFTGDKAQNTPDILDQWRTKGESAGVSLSRLGETAADAMSKIMDLGMKFGEFVTNLTAADAQKGITDFINIFRDLYEFLNGIVVAFKAIYYMVKTIVSAVIEVIGIYKEIYSAPFKIKDAISSSKNIDEFKGKLWDIGEGFIERLDPRKAFEWTIESANKLAEVETKQAERFAQRDMDDLEAARREREKGIGIIPINRNKARIEAMEDRKKALENWIQMSAEQLRASNNTAGFNSPFSEAPAEIQRQFLKELENVNSQLKAMLSQPVTVYIGEDKVAQIVGRHPSVTGEDSLEEGGMAMAF